MISVIIPAWNCACFLAEAIDSALSQQGVEVEVVVVDDGSVDDTPSLLGRYSDRIVSIRQDNRGPGSARNLGWRYSRGSHILFLDADDTLLPGCLQALHRMLQKAPPRTLIYGRPMELGPGKKLQHSRFHAEHSPFFVPDAVALIRASPLTPSVLHSRQALENTGGWREDAPYLADEFDLHLREHLLGWRFQYAPIPVFLYRDHKGDRISTRRYTNDDMQIHLGRLCCLREKVQAHSALHDLQEINYAFSQVLWDAGRFALRCGADQAASGYFQEAAALHPNPISGRMAYKALVRVVGPYRAEKILQLKNRRR